MSDNVEMLQTLRDSGFFPNLNQTTQEGSVESVKWLIDNHVDINPLTRTCRSTPLHFAMASGMTANVLTLIEAKAQFLQKAEGKTPELVVHPKSKSGLVELLPYCEIHCHYENAITRRELARTRNRSWIDQQNLYRIGNDRLESVKTLLQHGANPNARDVLGRTPLRLAARASTTDCSKPLIAHGAKIRSQDVFLNTPFMEACKSSESNAMLLMNLKVNTYMINKWGQSALYLVSDVRLLSQLHDVGWDAHLKDAFSNTPANIAAWNFPQLATYIRSSTLHAIHVEELPNLVKPAYYGFYKSSKNLHGTDGGVFSLSTAAALGDIKKWRFFFKLAPTVNILNDAAVCR
ncbi:ankyrin [Karstenula rhodostoma CBS 690.94]|uniref:Ankyrin n=1 Tax=Karstenula rhodostoma CBS 690.94 TaxID=1392251 RepID=A0A9P4UIQ1_9PLEO|nr:ankyrin [Karstenula rhodostoma CBS 690.94]